ncbi:hypothetical protein FACS1894188_03600 [Clostridia bacterium]|nr:hypothetical protein FACS1894188_03600 [Clostridia bacterium]
MLENLKELRKSKGCTQAKMGEFLDCETRHYQRIEYGQVDLPLSKTIALADYFGVSIDYLVGRTDNPDVNK